jgi:hypothetical protein
MTWDIFGQDLGLEQQLILIDQSLTAYLSNKRGLHGNYIAFSSRQAVNIFEWLTEL